MNKHFFSIGLFFAINCQILYSQTNKLFSEYLSNSFREIYLSDTLISYSTFYSDTQFCNGIEYGKYKYQQYIPEMMGHVTADNRIYTCLMYRQYDYFITIFEYVTEDRKVFKNNGGYYYFVIYDETGKIINSYKLLRGTDQQWFKDGVNHDSELFISKNRIKHLLYGPYKVPEMEANCKEVIYEITQDGSLEKISEENYRVKKKDQWNW